MRTLRRKIVLEYVKTPIGKASIMNDQRQSNGWTIERIEKGNVIYVRTYKVNK